MPGLKDTVTRGLMAAAALLSAVTLPRLDIGSVGPPSGVRRAGRRASRGKPAKNYHRDVGRTKCWPRAQTSVVVSWGPSWLRPPLPKDARPRR